VALLLIRHAHAGTRHHWDGPDLDRPLNIPGREQAAALVERLARFPVEQVLASPYVRCQQTVAPLALVRKLPLTTSPELAEGYGRAAVALARSLAAADAVLCTHADVVPEVLVTLARADGFPLPSAHALPCSPGSTWVVHAGHDGRFVQAQYLPPP
jgi:8-oxo-dGTP diphosphatase